MVFEMDFNQVLEHVQINNIVLAAAGDGVVSGLDVSERAAGVNMSVDVAAGSCKVAGTTYTEAGVVNVAITAADVTHARKDLIIYDTATSNPIVVTGTPAATPQPPDITAGDILLAIVDVAANETEITNAEITDCIIELTKLDELAAPSDNTNLNATTAVHGLLKKLNNSSTQFMNGQGNWATPAGAGDMLKSTYDSNDDGIFAAAQIGNLPASKITSGILAVARGGTGVSDDTYDADKVDGYDAGNWSGEVAVSNGTKCTNLNADEVDGCHAGVGSGDVYKVVGGSYIIITGDAAGDLANISPSTDGYQLTTHAASGVPTWAAASDLIFSDTHCPKCGLEFQDGDDLILHVIGHNEVGDILTIPMHQSCVDKPKKTVMIRRKAMEDLYVLDEDTGGLKVQRVRKMIKNVVAKHRLKDGYVLDGKSGKARKLDDAGNAGDTEYELGTVTELVEETISEPVYEDREFEL